MKDYEIEDLPKMMVEQTYDPTNDKVLSDYRIQDYNSKEFKIHKLLDFLKPFARNEQKEESDAISENKEQKRSN